MFKSADSCLCNILSPVTAAVLVVVVSGSYPNQRFFVLTQCHSISITRFDYRTNASDLSGSFRMLSWLFD